MKLLFFFIDGFGIGNDDSAVNPLVRFKGSFFSHLLKQPLTEKCGTYIAESACLLPVSATLGVDGLPQSATGQTTLLTGVNAARKVGHHVQAFPGPQLAALLAEQGFIMKLAQQGYKVTGANAYLPNYFKLVAARKRRHSATTLALLGAGLTLRSLEELKKGQAVYQDMTNQMIQDFGFFDVPVITPRQAGRNLAQITKQNHFTLYEYFQTDRCGHKRDWQMAEKIVIYIDELLWGFWEQAEEACTLMIVSDHGNFEDFSVKTHTLNQVPVLIAGPRCRELAAKITDLMSIAPAIVSVMQGDGKDD